MNFTQRRERFREILAGDKCVVPAPVHDPISARIAEMLGFEAGLLPGPIAQAVLLAAPNHHMVMVTMSEMAEHISHMCRASDISLYAGAHHGYGNALNVMRTVEVFEAAGVSCMTIDDQVEPIPFGSEIFGRSGHITMVEEQLIPLDEYVGKLKAALAARQDPSLVIAARNSGLIAGDVPEAIRRVKAYEKAGADAIHLEVGLTRDVRGYQGGKPDPEITATGMRAIEAIHAETKLPLLTGQEVDRLDDDFLAANGIRIGKAGNLAFRASVKAMYESLKALREGKSTSELASSLVLPEVLAQAVRQDEFAERFKNYMT